MDFQELKKFLTKDMRMSHIYQPVMIKAILEAERPLTPVEIGAHFLAYDESQLEYYERITKDMPGRVLQRHRVVKRENGKYALGLSEPLTEPEKNELIAICKDKIREYQEKRGSAIWAHRKTNKEPVPGTVRYEVLKRARFRCELCGCKANDRALEVDHIIPRNRGGTNEISNLQALCYKCNAEKRDTDSTDFRLWKEKDTKEEGCPFCFPDDSRVIHQDAMGLVYSLQDLFPVTKGHTLVIPHRHVASPFQLCSAETRACLALVERVRDELASRDKTIQGFNVGFNDGEVAGQTVFHCHIHVIPRRKGDVDNPRGGLRHVIPEKGFY